MDLQYFVLLLFLSCVLSLEQYTPMEADWSSYSAKALPGDDWSHAPDGILWLNTDDWAEWDGTIYDPSKYSRKDFYKLICPTGDKVRGIKKLYEDNKPFANERYPTKAEVDEWHRLVLTHIRAMVGYTEPEYLPQPGKCLHLRALWSDERHRSDKWDRPEYPGTCDGDPNPHCGASFAPNDQDKQPYLDSNGLDACSPKGGGSEGIFGAAKANIGWSIKWSRPFCSTLGAEGFWGGHTGPWFHRPIFGWSWWDPDRDDANSNAILRTKWSGSRAPSKYTNPDITNGRFEVDGLPGRFKNVQCENAIWKSGPSSATECYELALNEAECGKRYITYVRDGGCACYPEDMNDCEVKYAANRDTWDFEPIPSSVRGYYVNPEPDHNGRECQNIQWKTTAGDAMDCLKKLVELDDPECGYKFLTFNVVNMGCACYPSDQETCETISRSGRTTYEIHVDPSYDPNAVVDYSNGPSMNAAASTRPLLVALPLAVALRALD